LDPYTSLDRLVGLLVLLGLGTGLFTSPISSAIVGSVPRERRGVASGVMSTARGLGMVLGFCLGGAVFTALRNQTGLAPTPAATGEAVGTALCVAAGLATLATAALCTANNPLGAAIRFARAGVRLPVRRHLDTPTTLRA
jgi:MFS family permease